MGGVCWRGGSQEIAKPLATARLKMEDVCILYNVIKTFWWRKMTKVKRQGPFVPFKLQMALAHSCRNTLTCLCQQPNTWIVKGRNWSMGCWLQQFLSLAWVPSGVANLWLAQYQGSKFVRVELVMTMLVKVRMPSLVSTMSTHRQKELNVVEGNACNCSCPTWKLASHIMATKVSWIPSWVPVRSLPWTQRKRWIPIGSMGCVHTHWGMLTIEGWDSPSRVWNVMQKTREDNQKDGKIDRTIS
jgi:hypothetical protein